ncbi:hypothetical protein C7B65_06145 [Phormidesmis priestleyi ULC007]|uniref:Uncharacterized protein n=1 Tax=Phormidesmis priestleyi ULC007 TaxID=1920490 RepID=A0A2T1DKF8_9CYAN|nr:hypothetical protein [Phormidesmis priestleyi]PSB20980.1 hypothetical protein C7B65_06145 [Phormidesmis priestleyi ULC007]PZO53684.1 MAG: hypothetical protein DCF14_04705 [Phormidesmis priestleyi]
MSDTEHQFNFGFDVHDQAVKNDNNSFKNLLDTITTQGGDSVHQLFASDLSALQNLYAAIATGGESVWLNGTDPSNLPVLYVEIGNTYLMVGAYFSEDGISILQKGTADLETFEDVGATYVTLTTGTGTDQERTIQVMANTIEYAGVGIAEIELEQAKENVIETLVGKTKEFVSLMVESLIEVGELDAVALDAKLASEAQKAGESAGTDGEEIVISETLTISANIEFVLGVAGVVFTLGTFAYGLIMLLLEKRMMSYVRFFNATSQEIDFSLCFIEKSCTSAIGPLIPNDVKTIPGISPAWVPAWMIGSTPIHYIDLAYFNTDLTADLGFVLKAAPNETCPGFNVVVNIPNTGENKLYGSFNTQDDCPSYWASHKDSPATLTFCATSGNFTLRVATNQLKGESSSPTDGTMGYNYEYAIVLEEN